MRTLLLLLIILATTSIARADCLACWELRKVKITLKNGDTKTGFVLWNEAWMDESVKNWKELKDKFPENFVAYTRNRPEPQFYLLTKVTTVKNDSLFEFKATTKEDQQILPIDDVQKIVEIDKEADNYRGAGEISTFTLEELKLLNTNPHATYKEVDSVSDTYFLSCITRQQLKKLRENDKITRDDLTKLGVITVTIGYD